MQKLFSSTKRLNKCWKKVGGGGGGVLDISKKNENLMAVKKVGGPPVIILATRILKQQLPKEEGQIRQVHKFHMQIYLNFQCKKDNKHPVTVTQTMKQQESKQGSKRIMRKVTFFISQRNPNPC
ncbi:hypothetical protein Hanom_Chr00s008425g01740901 [Helianthus anomalus]